jgi:hypothetical protein
MFFFMAHILSPCRFTSSATEVNIAYNNQLIKTVSNIKTLGVYINDTFKRRGHIDGIIPKLSSACYIMRGMRLYVSLNVLKTIYYSYFDLIISYGLIFGGNSPHSLKVFRIQKKIIRIMMGYRRTLCRNLFRKLKILPLHHNIFSYLCYLWWRTKISLFQFQKSIIQVQDNLTIFINLQRTFQFAKRECIVWVLKYLTIFLHILKICLIM